MVLEFFLFTRVFFLFSSVITFFSGFSSHKNSEIIPHFNIQSYSSCLFHFSPFFTTIILATIKCYAFIKMKQIYFMYINKYWERAYRERCIIDLCVCVCVGRCIVNENGMFFIDRFSVLVVFHRRRKEIFLL